MRLGYHREKSYDSICKRAALLLVNDDHLRVSVVFARQLDANRPRVSLVEMLLTQVSFKGQPCSLSRATERLCSWMNLATRRVRIPDGFITTVGRRRGPSIRVLDSSILRAP